MANNSRIDQIKTFLEKTPKDSFLRYALAIEYIALGDDLKAEEIFRALLVEDPNYFATYYHMAKLYERKGEQELAEKTYEQGIKVCQELNEQFALRELRSAYDELLYD